VKEVDVAKPIVTWLEADGWDLYFEVRMGGHGSCPRADIVALKNEQCWVIETKTTFGLSVIRQAYSRRLRAHYASVGVLSSYRSKDRTFAETVCTNFGIGVINVDRHTGTVTTRIEPALNEDLGKRLTWAHYCVPEQKTEALPGSSGSYSTPYKTFMHGVKAFLTHAGPCTAREIVDNVPHHYSTDATARASLRNNLDMFEKDWCEEAGMRGNAFLFAVKQEKK